MIREDFHMTLRAANRQAFNPTCLKHRNFDGHIATAKNCGTHWIKYMLSLALAEKYGLPAPESIRDDAIVGHTKTPPKYKHIPQIALTHSHPHYLMRLPIIHTSLRLPKFVVLVRDIRSILVSMYEKSRGEHLDEKMRTKDVSFSRYLRGDVTGRTRIEDIYGLILFFNAWGEIAARNPGNVLSVRYEDLQTNTQKTLQQVCTHIGLDLPDDIIAHAISASSKNSMKERIDENDDKIIKKIVNTSTRNDLEWYSAQDMDFLRKTCARHLKHDFGYSY